MIIISSSNSSIMVVVVVVAVVVYATYINSVEKLNDLQKRQRIEKICYIGTSADTAK